MRAWKTPSLTRYLAVTRESALDVECEDRPSVDHIWERGFGWVVPVDVIDRRAASAIDAMDRLQFEHLFELENNLRDLRAKVNAEALAAGRPVPYSNPQSAQITRAQYRQALINRWKELNT